MLVSIAIAKVSILPEFFGVLYFGVPSFLWYVRHGR